MNRFLPCRKLTYPTGERETHLLKVPLKEDMLVPWRVTTGVLCSIKKLFVVDLIFLVKIPIDTTFRQRCCEKYGVAQKSHRKSP